MSTNNIQSYWVYFIFYRLMWESRDHPSHVYTIISRKRDAIILKRINTFWETKEYNYQQYRKRKENPPNNLPTRKLFYFLSAAASTAGVKTSLQHTINRYRKMLTLSDPMAHVLFIRDVAKYYLLQLM